MHDLVSKDGQYEVFEILQEPVPGQTWPDGPVLPEGHVVVMADGSRYQIAMTETVQTDQTSTMLGGIIQYTHRYTCTRDIVREW
jgi:hypothetical protein